MIPSKPEDQDLLLNAAIDGELDAAGMMDVERELAVNPSLAAQHARHMALRQLIRTHAGRESAPEHLRSRIAALAGISGNPRALALSPTSGRFSNWRRLAASIAAAAVLVTGAYTALRMTDQPDPITQAVVVGHMRAQVSGRPVDVISSDRHTVKPWLAGKVPVATSAVDLEANGFPLVGGRVDIVAGAAVPTLVYKRREHFLSVTELPSTMIRYSTVPKRQTVDGYAMLVWSDSERSYAAVSDIAPPELDAFVVAFRHAVANEQGDEEPHNTLR